MSMVYEFGDELPIVKVCLNREGWEWFRDLARSHLSPQDSFLREVERADAYLSPPDEDDAA